MLSGRLIDEVAFKFLLLYRYDQENSSHKYLPYYIENINEEKTFAFLEKSEPGRYLLTNCKEEENGENVALWFR